MLARLAYVADLRRYSGKEEEVDKDMGKYGAGVGDFDRCDAAHEFFEFLRARPFLGFAHFGFEDGLRVDFLFLLLLTGNRRAVGQQLLAY